ncbi:hypothetical protein EDB85DRAFT_2295983 [Lactarius pseudohatsudake]|nr:hypothetical protein EDB85DRAFT_2295983 [Lactarius pseudohatsudake]
MAMAAVDRATSSRGPGLRANGPVALRMYVRTETASNGAGRHTVCTAREIRSQRRRRGRRGAATLPVQLTPSDLLALALGLLSSLDTRFIEWLADDYAGGTRLSARRGWRDLLGGLVGAAVGGSGTASSSSYQP